METKGARESMENQMEINTEHAVETGLRGWANHNHLTRTYLQFNGVFFGNTIKPKDRVRV